MVVTRAPFRISLFGGGTDFPAWTREHGGAVLSGTIDKFCWISARVLPPFFPGHRHRVVWSKVEERLEISEIEHPAVRACMQFLKWPADVGVELHHQGDLPARSGMGASSSFTVGLLHALKTLKGSAYSLAEELVADAITVEQSILKERVGSQDQAAAGYGGFNRYEFTKDGSVQVQRHVVGVEVLRALEARLSLWYLGPRADGVTSSTVAQAYEPKPHHLRAMVAMVDEALGLLARGELEAVGRLLHDSWMLKREMGGSDPRADDAYDTAKASGALGGKLLGAGAGGFLLLFDGHLENALQVPFQFTSEGSRVVYCGATL